MASLARLAVAAIGAALVTSRTYDTSARRRTDAGVVNVHLVPHSHDDVGWVSTHAFYSSGAVAPRSLFFQLWRRRKAGRARTLRRSAPPRW